MSAPTANVFTASNSATVRRVSRTTIAVSTPGSDGEVLYLLSEPRLRSRVDGLETWRKWASEMTTSGSAARHQAVLEYIEQVEPDPAELTARAA